MTASDARTPKVARPWLEASLEQVRMTLAEEIASNAERGVRLQALMAWTGELHERAFGEAAPAFEMETRPRFESIATGSGQVPGGAKARPGGRQIPLGVQAVAD